MADTHRWAAGCQDWTSKPYRKKDQAEREARRLNGLGTCNLEHKVIEYEWRQGRGWITVATHPVPS